MSENTVYKCACGREFEKASSLKSHARFCSLYVKTTKQSKYKINDNLYRCECGKEFDYYQSLNAHLGHCDIHHAAIGTVRKKHYSELYHSMCWENKADEEIKRIHEKRGQTYKRRVQTGEIEIKRCKLSEETKQKIRKSTIKYIQSISNTANICRYNKQSIAYIDKLNETYNWHLQHAENGGEVQVAGYFLDGYDKDLNIAFEYDESKHYVDAANNVLKEKDIIRQNNIIKQLNCDFYRYNEVTDTLYCVHKKK